MNWDEDPKNERDFQEALDRIRQGRDYGEIQATGVDPKQAAEKIDASIEHRQIIDYKAVLERTGFKRFEAWELDQRYGFMRDGSPHLQGEWRNEKYRFAFTNLDILSKFLKPESFWEFMCEQRVRRRVAMQAAG